MNLFPRVRPHACRSLVLTLVAVLPIFGVTRVFATDITACGATIAPGDTGVLQVDLDCSAAPLGVLVLSGGELDLNGHAIAGGDVTGATVQGAKKSDGTGRGNFRIVGPGEISGTSQIYQGTPSGTPGCVQVNDGRVKISGGTGTVDIHGCVYGILGSRGVTPNGKAHVSLDHVNLHNMLFDGAAVGALDASDVSATDNGGQGLGASKTFTAQNVVARNNLHGHGLFAGTNLKGANVEATGNYDGVEAWKTLKLSDATVTGNAFSGVAGTHVIVMDSTITGNGGVDVLSRMKPLVKNTTCGKSLDYNSMSWHVCGNGSPSGAFLDGDR
jgi:hypothetical protein